MGSYRYVFRLLCLSAFSASSGKTCFLALRLLLLPGRFIKYDFLIYIVKVKFLKTKLSFFLGFSDSFVLFVKKLLKLGVLFAEGIEVILSAAEFIRRLALRRLSSSRRVEDKIAYRLIVSAGQP